MEQTHKISRVWRLWGALAAGVLAISPISTFAQTGHFILGAPGVLISDVTVNTGRDCFKLGDTLIVSGHGFGSESAGQVIAYAAQGPMTIESWTDAEIRFHVPTAAEAPEFTPLGDTLMILQGKDPFALYGRGPVFCGANKKP